VLAEEKEENKKKMKKKRKAVNDKYLEHSKERLMFYHHLCGSGKERLKRGKNMKKLSFVNKICRYLLLKKRRTHHRQFLE
jgi:hypothetical protein